MMIIIILLILLDAHLHHVLVQANSVGDLRPLVAAESGDALVIGKGNSNSNSKLLVIVIVIVIVI